MLKGVVAVELLVSRIEGKFKLSQNIARDDQEGAIAGLVAEGSAGSLATAEAMRRACGLAQDGIENHME
jgi:transcriptional regulator